jgi:hypothetical protein
MRNEVETLTLSVLMGTMSKAWLGYAAPTQIEILSPPDLLDSVRN